jgi:hypothetical protein
MEQPGYTLLVDSHTLPQPYILLYEMYRKEERCYDGNDLETNEVTNV